MSSMNNTNNNSANNDDNETCSSFPLSVEEAGAWLGACIPRCGKEGLAVVTPPTGMHSRLFAAAAPAVPSAELLQRLFDLRALLRSTTERPLRAAPSLLAVLLKLLGVSTSLAALTASSSNTNSNTNTADPPQKVPSRRLETPPLTSTPLRQLWVDCVVLCHALGGSKMDTVQLVRRMLVVASVNPRSAKAAGGVRIAALQVTAALLMEPALAPRLAPWTLDIAQVTSKALRSAGHNEPTYRVMAVRMASAAAVACRNAYWHQRRRQHDTDDEHDDDEHVAVFPGGMEDKALWEMLKILKQATTDKFPEVRGAAAAAAGVLAPFWVLSRPEANTHSLAVWDEVVVQVALKNLDDEFPYVADRWAEALARCLATLLSYHAAQDADADSAAAEVVVPPRFGARKGPTLSASLTSLPKAVAWLTDQFVKVGGEAFCPRAGGSFSVGGRNVRLGYTLALTYLLQLCRRPTSSSDLVQIVTQVLQMAVLDKQPPSTDVFGIARAQSPHDAILVRIAIGRVLRRALAEGASEAFQLTLLQTMVDLLHPHGVNNNQNAESSSATATTNNNKPLLLNAIQIQALLSEVSHAVTTLGPAAAAQADDLVAACLGWMTHADPGVRHEAAVACAAIADAVPAVGRAWLWKCVEAMQQHHAQLVAVSMAEPLTTNSSSNSSRFFPRRPAQQQQLSKHRPHECAIHGHALVVAWWVQSLPRRPGGLPRSLHRTALSAAEILLAARSNETLCTQTPSAVAECVRAGWAIVSGALSSRLEVQSPYLDFVFRAWKTTCQLAANGGSSSMPVAYDVACMDALLRSVVVFLKYNSELLLSMPAALTQVTLLLEDALPLYQVGGKFEKAASTTSSSSDLDSSKASLLEAFAWLPSGSFPMAADQVFGMAGNVIQNAIECDVTCSILPSLVHKEDSILDAKSFWRAKLDGQVGGAVDLEETLMVLHAEVAPYRERESISLLLLNQHLDDHLGTETDTTHWASQDTNDDDKPPTPLHEVGSWRRPIDPSCVAKVRLVDAAIQAFATTFGLKSGQEQQEAMDMLESLVPPLLMQLARSLGVNAALEQNVRSKAKEDSAAVENIAAVLLSCLQALPLHESTHNVPIGLGPPWMNKAKELLLTLLPSPSTTVRRASAEGLALLATVGVSEDAHILQSQVLHSLDEVLQGNKPDGKPRALSLESVSAARAGSLLTLAFIQRTNYEVTQRKRARAASRGSEATEINNLPVLQMMTRILPSVAYHGVRDYFSVRTCAMHAFAVLVSYSQRLGSENMTPEALQLLRKGVELVEENFTSSWTAASADEDRGQEAEKMTVEPSFLAVLLRFMTFLTPYIGHLRKENPNVLRRFCVVAAMIVDSHQSHPAVFAEGMAFFEVAGSHTHFLCRPAKHVLYSENPILGSIPFILETFGSDRPLRHATVDPQPCFSTRKLLTAAIAARSLASYFASTGVWSSMDMAPQTLAAIDLTCGTRRYKHAEITRSVAVCREVDYCFGNKHRVERALYLLQPALLAAEMLRPQDDGESDAYLRWLLFSRAIIVGSPVKSSNTLDAGSTYTHASVVDHANRRAATDFGKFQEAVSVARWQTKFTAATVALASLKEIGRTCSEDVFDFRLAEAQCLALCKAASESNQAVPRSSLVFHLEELITCACMACVATSDQSELFAVQEVAVRLLGTLAADFAKTMDPEEPQSHILDQYLTQMFSSAKHTVTANQEHSSTGSRRLFLAGCEFMSTIVENEVTRDPAVLKRLLRPFVPTVVPIFSFTDPLPEECLPVREEKEHRDTNSELLPLIGKLWLSSSQLLSATSPPLLKVASELVSSETGLACQAAAAAVDGVLLLGQESLSLVGARVGFEKEFQFQFFLLRDTAWVDATVRDALMGKWSSLASSSVSTLLKGLKSENSEEALACKTWVDVIVTLLLQGSLDVLTGPVTGTIIDPNSVLVDCLRGLAHVARYGEYELADEQKQELESVVDNVYHKVVVGALSPVQDDGAIPRHSVAPGPHESVVREACDLLRALTGGPSSVLGKDAAALVCILQPLDRLQKKAMSWETPTHVDLVSCALDCAAGLIQNGRSTEAFTNAMVQLLQQTIFDAAQSVNQFPERVTQSASLLLRVCIESTLVSVKRKRQIAVCMVRTKNWKAWEVMVPLEEGRVVAPSLEFVREIMTDPSDTGNQAAALASVQCAVHVPGLIDNLFATLGPHLCNMIQTYGSSHAVQEDAAVSSNLFGGAMKLLLVAYQNLATRNVHQALVVFLNMWFEAQLSVLRANGLPNHPVAALQADPSRGRMCAQSILHIAKTTPAPFKETVARLADADRALLEFAVRAEMTGYVTAGPAPAKKKLNLKSFKR